MQQKGTLTGTNTDLLNTDCIPDARLEEQARSRSGKMHIRSSGGATEDGRSKGDERQHVSSLNGECGARSCLRKDAKGNWERKREKAIILYPGICPRGRNRRRQSQGGNFGRWPHLSGKKEKVSFLSYYDYYRGERIL